ncbi:MAG TPA: hypothetical protein VGE48_00075 [Candidatus Paceibacterota bacterium]
MDAAVRTTKKYGYPKAYTGLKPLSEQIDTLASFAGRLGFEIDPAPVHAVAARTESIALPEGAEGWGAILSPGLVGSERREREVMIELLRMQGPYDIDVRFEHSEFFEEEYFRRDPLTQKMYETLSEQQPGDIHILPVQFGQRYAEVSDGEAIKNFGGPFGEFGLGLLAGASLIATHPDRIGEYADLGVSLPGDQYHYRHSSKKFSRLCLVKQLGQRVTLMHFKRDAEWMRDHGAASGFIWE